MTTAALNVDRDSGFLAAQMRPEVIAKMLSGVETNWKAFALSFSSCETPLAKAGCKDAPDAFHKSCAKVVGSIIAASSGHVDVAKDYMGTVCANSPHGWHEATCKTIGSAVTAQMSNKHRGEKACGTLWSHFVDEEKHETAESKLQAEKESAAKKTEEEGVAKKAAEEAAAKKAAEEAAAKKAQEEAAAKKTEEEAAAKKTEEEKEENNRQRKMAEQDGDHPPPMEAERTVEEETAPQPMEEEDHTEGTRVVETPQAVAKKHAEKENLYEVSEKRLEAVSYLKAKGQREQQDKDDRATEGVHMAPMAKRVKLAAPPSHDEDEQ